MIERRDLLLGAVCAGAVGVAEWLRPRHEVRLLPAGERLSKVVPTAIAGLTVPLDSRVEDIVYFPRAGEFLPRTEGEQRRDRLQAAMTGTVGDGLLLRASSIRDDSGEDRFQQVNDFLIVLLRSMSPTERTVLLGRRFAQLG